MRVPSRAFVAVVVFGLITILVTIPYTLMVLADYRLPPEAPYQWLAPEDPPHALGKKVFLLLASCFSVALTFLGWRALLHGARADARRRRRHSELKRELQAYGAPGRRIESDEGAPGGNRRPPPFN